VLPEPISDHLLDWFHVTMRITMLGNSSKNWLREHQHTTSTSWTRSLSESIGIALAVGIITLIWYH